MDYKRPIAINELTELVIGLCIKIHSRVGPDCYERVYEEILYYELTKLGLFVKRQLLLPIEYEELHIKDAYKIDLLVEEKLIVELKSKHPLPPVNFNQVHTHLSLTNLKHGLLINFKVSKMKEGIHRVYNNFGKEDL
ncbi:MAG TPA: GxxExxY protein [Chitinophagaceae bacterium]|nr:GxxExxY protein [Chitinophagaceae bacterium]MBP7107350.1 GxxExxY protein [Chitinophagaceae bacterium]MBP7314599.1 GxxExxY protein [Chitinophagaceae bacterium]HQV54187.1 GxxExxY protein [Chitinophagaceae bacterium]HQX95420.1 GxxExxY protein [Chitinophagaceae bacterium]